MRTWVWVVLGVVVAVVLLIWLGRRPRRWVLLVNVAVFVVLGLATVEAVSSWEETPEEQGVCKTPGASVRADAREARKRDQQAVNEARAEVQRIRGESEDPPTPSNRRGLREAERNVVKARAELLLWKATPVNVSATAKTAFKLGGELNSGVRSIAFSTTTRIPGPRRLDVHITPFGNVEGGKGLEESDVIAWATVEPSRTNGTVFFCVPPGNRANVPSGQFAGELVLGPDRVERLAIPVTVSLRNPHFTTVILGALATTWAASWYVFFLRRDDLSADIVLGEAKKANDAEAAVQADRAARVLRWPFGFWLGYWRWVCSMSGAITLVAGLVAAVTAFSTAYLGSATWAGSFGDWFTLCGAIATAFVAGGTAGKLAQLTPPDKGTPVPAPAGKVGDRPGHVKAPWSRPGQSP